MDIEMEVTTRNDELSETKDKNKNNKEFIKLDETSCSSSLENPNIEYNFKVNEKTDGVIIETRVVLEENIYKKCEDAMQIGKESNNSSKMEIFSDEVTNYNQATTEINNKTDSCKSISEGINYGFYDKETFETWLTDLYATKHSIWYVNTFNEMSLLLSEFEHRTESKFCTYFVQKNFGSTDMFEKKHKIRWDGEGIEFDGMPFMFLSNKFLDCQHVKNRRASSQNNVESDKKPGEAKKTCRLGDTMKFGCEAHVRLKEMIKFPEFKISSNTKWRRESQSRILREAIETKSIVCQQIFVVKLPSRIDHSEHPLGEGQGYVKEKIHTDIVMKIQELYLNDNSVSQIAALIYEYVCKEMPGLYVAPTAKRRKFSPAEDDIQNIIKQIRPLGKLDESSIDEINNLINSSETLSLFSVDNIKISRNAADKPSNKTESKHKAESRIKLKYMQTFLFLYQTSFQERLFMKHKQVLYVSEVNCDKLIKLTLPYEMYVLVVQTCLDYQVICTIVVSKQRKNGLIEAFQKIKNRFSMFLPKYYFLDCSEKLVNAFENVFPDSMYFYNMHSCCSHWKKFCNQNSNGLVDQVDAVLVYLQNMSLSLTEETLSESAALFEASDVWQSSDRLRCWFQGKWLENAKRWVRGYHPDDLHTMKHYKNTIVDATSIYGDEMKATVKPNGLATLLASIIEKIPNKTKQRYIENLNTAYENCLEYERENVIPLSCFGVPSLMLPLVHCYHKIAFKYKITIVKNSYSIYTVEIETCSEGVNEANVDSNNVDSCATQNNIPNKIEVKNNLFRIEYESVCKEGQYTVSFGDDLNFPFCTCSYWQSYKLPCIHMYAIFSNVEGWCYDMLSSLYRSNEALTLDFSYLNIYKPLIEKKKNQHHINPDFSTVELLNINKEDQNPHKIFSDQCDCYLKVLHLDNPVNNAIISKLEHLSEIVKKTIPDTMIESRNPFHLKPINITKFPELSNVTAVQDNVKSLFKVAMDCGSSIINLHINNDIPIVLT